MIAGGRGLLCLMDGKLFISVDSAVEIIWQWDCVYFKWPEPYFFCAKNMVPATIFSGL